MGGVRPFPQNNRDTRLFEWLQKVGILNRLRVELLEDLLGQLKSMQAGRMGYSTSQVGDLVASAVAAG